MQIVWFSWKDIGHPQAGGAEVVSHNLRVRLAQHGHKVHLITAKYANSLSEEIVEGVHVHRVGGRYSVYYKAHFYYKNKLKNSIDIVIDEMNTIPFFTPTVIREKNLTHILLAYQLARKVWFYQMIFPLSLIGYLVEPLYLYFLRNRYKVVVTESESTKAELAGYGFNSDIVKVFRVGMDLQPVKSLYTKDSSTKILFFGALRPMKRPLDAIKAFEIARDKTPALTMKIAGNNKGSYAKKVQRYIEFSRHKNAIEIIGSVSLKKKKQLMKEATLLLATSTKEGWGLIITEANSQGTPAIAYNVSGLNDSVIHNKTGKLSIANPQAMAAAIVDLLKNKKEYDKLRKSAYNNSKQFTFTTSYNDFSVIINRAHDKKN